VLVKLSAFDHCAANGRKRQPPSPAANMSHTMHAQCLFPCCARPDPIKILLKLVYNSLSGIAPPRIRQARQLDIRGCYLCTRTCTHASLHIVTGGLLFPFLMPTILAGNTEGVISRQASGLSFDFPPGDGATYFAGTEDGLIHKCSVSYNEQYLETYHGHTGPVYRIRCSPFCGRLFLSARWGWVCGVGASGAGICTTERMVREASYRTSQGQGCSKTTTSKLCSRL